MSTQRVSFNEYLKSKYIKKGEEYTHTRIGDKESEIAGGTYNIKDEDEFLQKYYDHVFVKGNKEYLTEKQRIEDAPLVVDIDMRYSTDVKERKHTKEHIIDLIDIYTRNICKLSNIEDQKKLEVFVMEKSDVNILDDKTKDGIHIIFGISMHKAAQVILRERILPELREIWDDLPFTNDIEDLVDDGVTRGIVNWQLYGSCKPNNQRYLLKYHFEAVWNNDKDLWEMSEKDVEKFNIKKNLYKLSVHCKTFPKAEVKESFTEEINKLKENLNRKKKTSKLVMKKSTKTTIENITNMEKLDEFVEEMIEKIEETAMDYELKETHEFTMILPRSYWGPGSYNKWIRVGWALKNTSKKLLATWLKFCSQSNEFNFGDIPELVDRWNNFDYNNPEGLTSRSIMYWARNDNINEYIKVRNATISYYMELTVKDNTDWDFAYVLYQMYKDEFVCVSIKNNVWYQYRNHRWFENDSGNALRMYISTKMHDMYSKKVQDATDIFQKMDGSDEKCEAARLRANNISKLCLSLKKTTSKNNIMKEAKELFYDNEFINKLDQNPYLLCFNNYVVDFKNKIHRQGQPDDYISKSTNIDYIPLDNITDTDSIKGVTEFMEELFPNEELRKYMWEHLASTLIGNNDNQTFNIYTGSGRNGKSKLVDLMSKMLGDYKAMVPVTLVTQKRNAIGSTSSEIVQLMGVRYAVMQEPSKNDIINEGIMKEITGGDPIQGRALFKEAVTFIPQFKLVVCTNTLFDIKSNDDGTWRRIRVCDFMSKFLEKPYEDEDKFPKEDYPYQYPIDRHIDEKFNKWAPVLASMLVNMTYEKLGVVKDCDIVLSSSDQYREGQDYLAEFCKEKIRKVDNGKIKKTELWTEFKQWYIINYGKTLPKAKELNEFMDKRFGKYKGKWSGVAINYDDDDDEDD
jgi:P4 family phage/plasmid primase-like protien